VFVVDEQENIINRVASLRTAGHRKEAELSA
jgi:hypothetical protein